MIDLHTHTTASDGRCAPDELVRRAHVAGVGILSLTDHDTVAGCEETAAACRTVGIEFVTGIEITAMRDDTDVHILGYFVDVHSTTLHAFLAEQRQRRIERLREMLKKLATHGIALDAEAIVKPALDEPKRAAGRPWIARALVAAGHVADTSEAFDRWLARGRPAFVPRAGGTPREVIARIHDAGGIASMAHPGLLNRDVWLEEMASDGLDAVEAYHSDHDAAATTRYLELASRLSLAVSGGSDFHGDPLHGPAMPGAVSLPREHYDGLLARRPTSRATASGVVTSS